jgi:hypothetical protein
MGRISERLADVARRCGDLTPLADPVRRLFWEGNRAARLAGVDAEGRPFAPLAQSTLKRRKGHGPPLAPEGEASKIITGYVVQVTAGPGRLTFAGSWPDLDWIQYAADGTRHMPARDPLGFRRQDIDQVRDWMRGYILRR